ncbi:hypothetical protein JAAARDRAFT_62004 [Jaapia argillacea MUCL 33604]|uniref:thioredoxin-dependent peroxiredoxin n=1 Tax=Jaapia argillacea MUCL 33604 TaxID=933084 RepID=A0A067PM46_9AGAM|nr:hypothetical protein JAAARDRAFT_62004 [Jaapia argillacea MUCL 33604]
MPPRKAVASADDSGEAEAPRRSTRISGQAKPSEPAAPKEVKEKKPRGGGKKRAAPVEEEEEEESSKKAKATEAEAESSAPAPEVAPVDIGDSLPSGLTLKNEKGEDVDVGTLASEKGVVLFLVPKADTPGCTNQACGFRDIYPDFTSVGYDVYCLSADTPAAQTKWQTKKELPYSLLSDPRRHLIRALGAADGNKTKRSHFVFEKGGKLLDRKMPVKPVDSPKLALEFIKSLGES